MPDNYWLDLDEEEGAISSATRRRYRARFVRSRITPEIAGRASGLMQQNSSLGADLLQGILTLDIPEGPALQQVVEQDDGGDSDSGFLGGVRNFVGERVSDVAGVADDALSGLYEQAVKPFVRGVSIASDFASQELVQRPLTALGGIPGITRMGPTSLGDIRQRYNEYGDSALLNAIQGDMAPEEEGDGGVFGKGLFGGGRSQAESERERVLQIRGRRGTLGQAIAASTVGQFMEPGDFVYDVTAGVSGFASEVVLDPLALATGGAAAGARAARALDKAVDVADASSTVNRGRDLALRAGLIRGDRRNTIIAERTQNFFADRKMLKRLAEADEYEIYQKWSQSPANRVQPEVIAALGEAKDEASVAQVLHDAIQRNFITERGFYSGPGHFIRGVLTDSKWVKPLRFTTREGKYSGLAPTGTITADDIGGMAGKVDSLLRQANVPREDRAELFSKIIRIEPGDHTQTFDVMRQTIRKIVPRVEGNTKLADELVEHYQGQVEAFRAYGVDALGNPIQTPFTRTKVVQNFDGTPTEVVVPSIQLLSEANTLALSLPDAQDIRRAASNLGAMRWIYQRKGWDWGVQAANAATTKVFKPLAILRPAYVVRIGMEEQARLIAAHHDSIFTHPARFIMANVLARDELTDVAGNPLQKVSEMHGVVARRASGLLEDPLGGRARAFDITSAPEVGQRASRDFLRGWQGELGQIASDPIARKLTELWGDTDELKEWAKNEGLPWVQRYARTQGKEGKALLRFDEVFDDWAAGIRTRVEAKTAGWDPDLVDAVANDRIPYSVADGIEESRKFRTFLQSKADEGRRPARVKVEALDTDARRKGLDTLVDTLFDVIAAKPTNFAARSPAFRASIVQRTTEALDVLANDELREEVVNAAIKGLRATGPEQQALNKALAASRGRVGVIDNIGDFNDAVTSRAADDVRDLLFDVTKRGAAQEAFNVVVPFLDAWKEVSVTWMRLLKDNPAFFVRAQAGYRELRDQGVFYQTPEGEEVFRYPGGGVLSDVIGAGFGPAAGAAASPLGALDAAGGGDSRVALEGRVQGLNMVTQGIGPGFGPLVQWSAGLLKDPKYEVIKDFMAPFGVEFGSPNELLNLGDVGESLLPAWFKKFANGMTQGAIDERQWNSTTGDAMAALSASGKYDLNNPRDVEKLKNDAERYATFMLLGRSLTQFAGPTGANATVELNLEDSLDNTHADWNPDIDPDGKWFRLNVMAEEYFRLEQIYGGDVAASKFHEMYGAEPWFITQGATSTLGKPLPVTTEGGRWIERNRDVFERHPLAAGFFAPVDENPDLDFSVYAGQIDRGERISLTPEQQSRMAMQTRVRAIYSEAQRQLEAQEMPYGEKQTALAMIAGRLESIAPGWRSPVLAMPRPQDKIGALYEAANDPDLADNPLTEQLRTYLNVRDQALEDVRGITGRGNATLAGEDAEPHRAELRQIGQRLAMRNPQFMEVWTSVLKRELEEE